MDELFRGFFFPDAADYKLELVSLNTASVTVNSQHCLHGSREKKNTSTRYSFRNVLTNPDVNCKNFSRNFRIQYVRARSAA